MRIVLASASPRRLQLLTACGHDVEVRPADVDETQHPGEHPGEMVLRLARAKAAAIAPLVSHLVVAADTTVVVDGDALAKPVDARDAIHMLSRLRGRTHQVLTGWCVRQGALSGGNTVRAGVVSTGVTFRVLDDAEIAAYVATGEPLDKAGAYGIQGLGGALVDRVEGSYPNVVGLPVAEVIAAIRELA